MKKELETLTETMRIYNQGIGMEFGIEKYAVLIMKSAQWQIMDRIEQTSQESIRILREKENYKYLWILAADTMKQAKWKKMKKAYLSRTRNMIHKTKLYRRKLIKGINILAVTLVRGNWDKWTKKWESW